MKEMRCYGLQDKVFGKAKGRRLFGHTPTTDNTAKNIILKPIKYLAADRPGHAEHKGTFVTV